MQKYFNTAGPIKPANHYHIDPLHRLDWEEVQHLIESEKYFVLHAPRQTGKTSTLLAMSDELNEAGVYKSLYVNIEAAQAARNDVEGGMTVVCETLAAAAYAIQPELESIAHKLLAQQQARGVLTTL
uniref:AAA-like domain-containing protein n=1 Tax=uncultured Thiotrichaceae bacterium TaxID=298394 RepID=A0A6S6UM97_9GAMM|nr:MAG: AAA-like domain-containing protein [uncultured Thiotrichaceae bacterium]